MSFSAQHYIGKLKNYKKIVAVTEANDVLGYRLLLVDDFFLWLRFDHFGLDYSGKNVSFFVNVRRYNRNETKYILQDSCW